MGQVIKETELSHTWKTRMKIKLSHRAKSRYGYSKKIPQIHDTLR